MLNQFNMTDSKLPQQVRLDWSRLVTDDCEQPRPDEAMDGFWPSGTASEDGYIGTDDPKALEIAWNNADARMAAFENGDWTWVGVQARVRIMVPVGGTSFACYELTSPGLWSIESDSGEEYLSEVYENERATLEAHLRVIAAALAI